jgi:hypothetical protein
MLSVESKTIYNAAGSEASRTEHGRLKTRTTAMMLVSGRSGMGGLALARGERNSKVQRGWCFGQPFWFWLFRFVLTFPCFSDGLDGDASNKG